MFIYDTVGNYIKGFMVYGRKKRCGTFLELDQKIKERKI
ncbi:hypothetical protein BN1088_1430726 [Sphingobacterium sp. PM2-P1-29]|nr:hypothetical protein BN1088_1430726 [Sphingobacterium sp. PM2-P1-29]